MAFSGLELFIFGSAVLQGGRFADVQELRFEIAKRSHKDCAELQGCQFADFQGWRFQAAKCSDMSLAIIQEGRLAGAQESRIQGANRLEMGSADRKEVGLLMHKNRVSRLRIVQISVIPFSKGVD